MKILGRFILTAFLLLLASCSQSPAPEGEATTPGFLFDIDPARELAALSAAPSSSLAAQAVSGPRVLSSGSELLLSAATTFGPDNTLTITATFTNATTDATFLPPFTFAPATVPALDGYLASTEPVVTEADLGLDGVLVPGETTLPLTFTVTHTGAPFTYLVNAVAPVETGCVAPPTRIGGQTLLAELAGCNAVLGDLGLGLFEGPPAALDLSVFGALKAVTGDLSIVNTTASDLSGFGALSFVGGMLDVSANPELETVGGFNALAQVGGNLGVSENPVLTSVAGFPALEAVGGDARIDRNEILSQIAGFGALANVGGSFSLVSNFALSEVAGFPNLEAVGESFEFLGYNGGGDFPDFPSLGSVGEDFSLGDSDASSLPGFNALSSVGSFSLGINPFLASVSGFNALSSVGDFRIVGQAALTSVSGFGALLGDVTRSEISFNPLFDCSAEPQASLALLPVSVSRRNLVDCPTR